MELKILQALIQGRSFWEEAKDLLLEHEKDFSPEAHYLIGKVGEYYLADPSAKQVDREILCAQVVREFPSAKRSERIIGVIKSLPTEVSSINILKELVSLKKSNLSLDLIGMLSAGTPDDSRVYELMSEYIKLNSSTQTEANIEELQAVKVSDLVNKSFNKENLIQLWPKQLNDAVDGGAKPGHHILVFAPTEMGKTLFVINMVAGFVAQGLKTLYIGNEDPAADIYMRYLTRLVGQNKYKIMEHPDKAQKILDEKNYGLLTLVPLAPGNFGQISKLVDKHEAKVVILDQLRNLDVKSDGRTQQLEKAATEARNLAKSRNVLVISVTQAGDSASGKRVLSRGDVDSSNVGIPGQVDLMIGIGATAEEEGRNLRVLSFPKNKLSGKHEHFVVQIDPFTSKVVE